MGDSFPCHIQWLEKLSLPSPPPSRQHFFLPLILIDDELLKSFYQEHFLRYILLFSLLDKNEEKHIRRKNILRREREKTGILSRGDFVNLSEREQLTLREIGESAAQAHSKSTSSHRKRNEHTNDLRTPTIRYYHNSN